MTLSYIMLLVGILFLPFESIPLQVSVGWNGIAHIFFIISATLALTTHSHLFFSFVKSLFSSLAIPLLFSSIITITGYILIGLPEIAVATEELVKVILSLMFGFTLYYHFAIKKSSLLPVLSLLVLGYSFSLFKGILARLVGIDIWLFSFQRGSLQSGLGKNPFTFSEPSFVAPHLIGVLLLFLVIAFKERLSETNEWKRCSLLFFLFFCFALGTGSSLRLLVDASLTAIVFVSINSRQFLISTYKSLLGLRINKSLFLALSVLLVIFITVIFSRNEQATITYNRFANLFAGNDAAQDMSTTIRSMRLQVAWNATTDNLYTFLFGGGFSNLCNFTKGLPGSEVFMGRLALSHEYNSILALGCLDLSYSLVYYLLASFGVIGFLLFALSLFKKECLMEYFIVLIVALQTESLAFYSIGIYLWRYESYKLCNSPSIQTHPIAFRQ